MGKGSNNAKVFLEKRYKTDWGHDSYRSADFKKEFEGEMNNTNIEVGVVGEDKTFQVLTAA